MDFREKTICTKCGWSSERYLLLDWNLCRKATSLAVYRSGWNVVGAHGAGTTFSNNDAVAIRDIMLLTCCFLTFGLAAFLSFILNAGQKSRRHTISVSLERQYF